MAYFLPSYFQKRLLRYALSRLDFIETDDLDLESLGITWGQRSVIELKDVGIQISKLASLLSIPSSILVTRARIGLLRLTIPADLYASGILVEVGGIDVQVKLQDTEEHESQHNVQPRPSSGLSKGNRADRPRIGSSAVHDPGGTGRWRPRNSTVGETGIPTSEDLALSFLESEPPEERKELQSIVQSQSQVLQESTSEAAGDGIGTPGGFELPTFVANFFKGVADRLSVAIKDMTITVAIDLPQDGSDLVDTVKLMLKVSEIELEGVRINGNEMETSESTRSVTVRNIELVLLTEPEIISQIPPSSTNSSPRLSRAHTKLSSSSSKSMSDASASPQISRSKIGSSQHVATARSTLCQQTSGSSSGSMPAFASSTGLGLESYPAINYGEKSMEDSSLAFRPQVSFGRGAPLRFSVSDFVDNQSNAENLARRGQLDAEIAHTSASIEQSQDLAESKVFSHGEAESMYMSAVSREMEQSHIHHVMPGAWDWSEPEEQKPEAPKSPNPETKIPQSLRYFGNDLSAIQETTRSKSRAPVDHGLSGQEAIPTEPLPTVSRSPKDPQLLNDSLVAKRFLSISYIRASISKEGNLREEAFELAQQTSENQSRAALRHSKKLSFADESIYSQLSSQIFATTEDLSHDQVTRSKMQDFDHGGAQARQAASPVLEIGTISVALDLPIGRLFVRIWQEIKPLAGRLSTDRNTKPPNSEPSPFEAKVKQVSINVCEEVAEFSHEHGIWAPFASETCSNEELLLQISLSRIALSVLSDGSNTRRRLTVNKISVSQKSKSVMSFADTANVRTSISASVLTLSDDLVVVVRRSHALSATDVQMKSLRLKLDLLQIDDVLGRSGGLSSLLDLGNSIASTTSTIRGGTSNLKPPASRQRNVRFDTPDTFGANKVNARIAGISVELLGSDCAMHVRSSAIKVVYRQKLFGLQIDCIEVEGPLLKEQTEGDIKLKINNTRLEYSDSPREADLDRLLSMLAPSSDKHELEKDDDIMVDTLIRQRRKGGVLRLTLHSAEATILGLDWQKHLVKLGDELSRLSSVSKYLPEDDRPGMLTLALVKKVDVNLELSPSIGTFSLKADLVEGAHVNVPSLMAAHVTSLQVLRGKDSIIGGVVSSTEPKLAMSPPMIMVRFIADEMEPTVRLKVFNLLLEYKVPIVAALIELGNAIQSVIDESRSLSPTSSTSSSNAAITRSRNKTRISLLIRDSALGLNPLSSPAKGIMLLSDTTLTYAADKSGQLDIGVDLRKLSILICDDVSTGTTSLKNADSKMFFDESLQVQQLVVTGFVPVAFLSAASVAINVSSPKPQRESTTDVELKNGLLIVETCADSTQTMVQVLNELSPPALPSKVEKYRTEIVPIQDMLASFTGNAYFTEPGHDAGLQAMSRIGEEMEEDEPEFLEEPDEAELDDDPDFMGQLWQSHSEAEAEPDDMSESYLGSELTQSNISVAVSIPPVSTTDDVIEASQDDIMAHSMLNFQEDHFARKEAVGGTAHRWDSKQNTYGLGGHAIIQKSPLKVKVRDVHVIWHLFDGYDWQVTRDRISKAVRDIEDKAAMRRPRSSSRLSPRPEDEDESEIGDFLFNSIYIGVPTNRDPRELANAINREIDDMTSEAGSDATATTMTTSPTRRPSGTKVVQKRLRLERGKNHKMAFELKGISTDFVLFPAGSGEVESSVDVRIHDLEIIDQLPTSTWKKFATYMRDAGEREVDTNMVHIEILNVKPVADLAASEIVLKLTVLPLRLHVDQDAIDFMSRFFEFKDERVPISTTPSTPPFLQRVEVNPIRLKLDFKPKRVDYGGLRSGRTTEFMNFFVLDRADMVLRRVILYGVSGFDRMGIMLNNIWSPDVRRNQLPGVLAGLAPIRSLVDVGSGVRDLVVVPMREYKKDGRIVRSIQKGALAFAKTTTKELVNLGAKLAIGTQTVLQDTERFLGHANEQERWEDQGEDEEKKQISLYADQPLGILQGLRGAYASLERDLLLAKDAIVAVPGEVMATESATGAAQAVLKSAPTIILRPVIGASKAVGQTLLGAGNTFDRENYRRMQEKYKRH